MNSYENVDTVSILDFNYEFKNTRQRRRSLLESNSDDENELETYSDFESENILETDDWMWLYENVLETESEESENILETESEESENILPSESNGSAINLYCYKSNNSGKNSYLFIKDKSAYSFVSEYPLVTISNKYSGFAVDDKNGCYLFDFNALFYVYMKNVPNKYL